MSRIDPTRAGTLIALAALCAVASAAGTPPDRAVAGPSVYHLAALTQQAGPHRTAPPRRAPEREPRRETASLEAARRLSAAFADVAAAVTPAVVQIQTERSLEAIHRGMRNRLEDMFDRLPDDHPVPEFPQLAGGSGVLVSGDGLILTNNHVVSGADRITVTLWDKRVFDATVVGTDPTTDMALILIDEGGLPAAELGDSDRLRVGEWVLAIGNPGFRNASTLDFTVTSGIVSAKGRPLDVIQNDLTTGGDPEVARYAIEDFIQTDAAINPGNSGGPLLNLNGEVLGVNSAIRSVTGFNSGVGFSIPVNAVRRIVPSLIENGSYVYSYMGVRIQTLNLNLQEIYDLPQVSGAYVVGVTAGGPAAESDLVPADENTGQGGDLIIAVDGQPVANTEQLIAYLVFNTEVGQTITLTVLRGNETVEVPLTLAARP